MRKYETMFILNANLEEEVRKQTIENLFGILKTNGAVISEVNEWGVRELAYEINDDKRGYYVVANFETEEGSVAISEFERNCNITSSVYRYIVVRLED